MHRTLLSHGVLIAEHMSYLGELAGQRIETMFLGLSVVGSGGVGRRRLAAVVAPWNR